MVCGSVSPEINELTLNVSGSDRMVSCSISVVNVTGYCWSTHSVASIGHPGSMIGTSIERSHRGNHAVNQIPPGEPFVCPLRILTVDCQLDHLFLVVRAWADDGSSRLIWNEKVFTYTDVETIQERFSIHPNLVFIDAGYATYDVYRAVTDPQTGMTFGYLRFTDTRANKVFVTLECLYGFALGKAEALKRIVKP